MRADEVALELQPVVRQPTTGDDPGADDVGGAEQRSLAVPVLCRLRPVLREPSSDPSLADVDELGRTGLPDAVEPVRVAIQALGRGREWNPLRPLVPDPDGVDGRASQGSRRSDAGLVACIRLGRRPASKAPPVVSDAPVVRRRHPVSARHAAEVEGRGRSVFLAVKRDGQRFEPLAPRGRSFDWGDGDLELGPVAHPRRPECRSDRVRISIGHLRVKDTVQHGQTLPKRHGAGASLAEIVEAFGATPPNPIQARTAAIVEPRQLPCRASHGVQSIFGVMVIPATRSLCPSYAMSTTPSRNPLQDAALRASGRNNSHAGGGAAGRGREAHGGGPDHPVPQKSSRLRPKLSHPSAKLAA